MAMHPITCRIAYPDATSLLSDAKALHTMAQQEGVVVLRGVLDARAVVAAAEAITQAAADVGWIEHGRAKAGVHEHFEDPSWRAWYLAVQRSRAFHALAHQPRLLSAVAAIVGGDVLAHPRNICRWVGPHTQHVTTPPHQDVWYIGGTQDIWTAWAPMVDCPEELGGLAVLPGSHHRGVVKRRPGVGAGGSEVDADLGHVWAWESLRAGDVLLFHGLTVHQGCDNRSDRARCSVDLRFQRVDQPVRADSLQPHYDIAPWDELYQGWANDDQLRYYWQRQALTIVA